MYLRTTLLSNFTSKSAIDSVVRCRRRGLAVENCTPPVKSIYLVFVGGEMYLGKCSSKIIDFNAPLSKHINYAQIMPIICLFSGLLNLCMLATDIPTLALNISSHAPKHQ